DGIRVGPYIFLSGMGPIDPVTGERNHGPIAEQIRTTLSNMQHMLESAGSSLERVVRVHVVLADVADMPEMARVYREFFPIDPPARTAWSLQLRFGNGCEIECLALAPFSAHNIGVNTAYCAVACVRLSCGGQNCRVQAALSRWRMVPCRSFQTQSARRGRLWPWCSRCFWPPLCFILAPR